MKILRSILFLLNLAAVVSLQAAPVAPERAMQVARGFFAIHDQPNATLKDATSTLPFSEVYLFTHAEGGFVLVAGDDCVQPILGYSLQGRFVAREMPVQILNWFKVYTQQIREARSLRLQSLQTSKRIAEQWTALEQGATTPTLTTAVAPLMSTTWDQGQFYNTFCPYDETDGTNALVGCTATAMAQVMKYWNFPATGYGSHSYSSPYGPLNADFGSTTYDWSNMPNALNYRSSATQINAVATLMSHAGISIDMAYSTYGSNSYITHFGDISANNPSAESALVRNFKYKPTAHLVSRSIYGDSLFAAIVRHELDNARPVLSIGQGDGGHIFVIDGYDNDGLFHLNWGWSGFCDGYYAINDLNPSSEGYITYYDRDNHIIAGVEPSAAFGNGGTITAASNDETSGTVSGGGSYTFGSTKTLKASASSGCKFARWDDYCNYNPRSLYCTGGDYTVTAIFERLTGDTLGYASTLWLDSWGANSNELYWGVKFPASSIAADHMFCAGQLYPVRTGNYTMTIYSGTSSRSNTLGSVDFTVTEAQLQNWLSVPLPEPVAVPYNHTVWVTFNYHNSTRQAVYPAAVSYSSGNRDAFLWGSSFGSTGTNYENYSFMVRGIFTPNPQALRRVTVRANNDNWGTVTGSGSYLISDTVTISATPRRECAFLGWSDGDTHAVREIIVLSDTTFVANFECLEDISETAHDAISVTAIAREILIRSANNQSLSVYDMQGRLIAARSNAAEEEHFVVPAEGIYLVRIVQSDGTLQCRRVVIL